MPATMLWSENVLSEQNQSGVRKVIANHLRPRGGALKCRFNSTSVMNMVVNGSHHTSGLGKSNPRAKH